MPFSNVVLLPDQLALVQRAFRIIVAEPWFDRNLENEHALASVIVREFEHGTLDEGELADKCRAVAKERFSANAANTG